MAWHARPLTSQEIRQLKEAIDRIIRKRQLDPLGRKVAERRDNAIERNQQKNTDETRRFCLGCGTAISKQAQRCITCAGNERKRRYYQKHQERLKREYHERKHRRKRNTGELDT